MSKGLRRTLDRAALRGGTLRSQLIPIDVEVDITDGAPGHGTAVIRGLPEGNLMFFGALAYLQFTDVGGTGLTATFDGDFSIGTVATADGDLADAGEADIIASTAMGAATAGVSPRLRALTANSAGVLSNNVTILDNTDGSLELNLNVLIDDAAISANGTLRAQGELHLALLKMGDD